MFNSDNVVISGGNFNINEPQTAIQVVLKAFSGHYVPSATHDNNDTLDTPKCHSGTRVSFLRRLSNWVRDVESSESVTWLHGPAGAGKSAIARSLAEISDNEGLLAGSFFFFKTDPKRNSVNPFVATLAYQIARSIPDTLPYIATAVEEDPTICSRSLETQFKRLIADPICTSESFVRQLLIIDGLDECINRMAILKVVFHNLPHLHRHFKFLIISRPEYDIQGFLESGAPSPGQLVNTIKLLGDLQAYDDVRAYLRDSFDRIKQTHPLREYFTPDWPSDDAIERLVEKSSGHFIYASTVTKYIENDFDRPQKRLDVILNLNSRRSSQNPYGALDALYLDILTSSRVDHGLLVNILSIVVQADRFFEQLSYQSISIMKSTEMLESILVLEPGGCEHALLDLKSLVEAKGTVKFWHKSFSDFLLDPLRSQEFHAYSAPACTLMAKCCLWLLSGNLPQRLLVNFDSIKTRRECHHLLSFCCNGIIAVVGVDLQIAMMKYKSSSPAFPITNRPHILLLQALKNEVIEAILCRVDDYFLSELRHWVPLKSEIMNGLREVILPHNLHQKILSKQPECPGPYFESYFLYFMFFEHWSPEAERIICNFFYSKSRAFEYYLGKSMMQKWWPWKPTLKQVKKKTLPAASDEIAEFRK